MTVILGESEKLFSKFLFEKLKNGGSYNKRIYTIRKVISACSGHPRSLEKFRQVLNDDAALKTDPYASLTERVARKLQTLVGISLPIIRMALLGNEVPLIREIETSKGKLTLKGLISSGMYINSLTVHDEVELVVLTLSSIALQHFCVSEASNDVPALANILSNLLTDEFLFEREVLDGKPFERFHGNWELLYRELRKNTIVDLNNIYGFREDPKQEIKIKLQQKKIAYCHRKIEFPPKEDIYDENKIPFENLVDFLFVPKKSNNSSFDMVTFEKKADESGYIAINIECRFSYPNSTTTFESNDILKKYELMTSKYQEHVSYSRKKSRSNPSSINEGMYFGNSAVGKLKMNEDDIYLVFIVWRDVGNIDYSQYNGKNIIIVERKNLEKIYTPTLAARPHFYSEILNEIK